MSEEHVARMTDEPPEDTRAWTRAMLLRYAGPDAIEDVDWDTLRFRIAGTGYWPTYRSLDLGDPLRFTRAEAAPLFERAAGLDQLLDALEAGADGSHALAATARERPGDSGEAPVRKSLIV